MRFKSRAARVFEVDFILEQHRRPIEQLLDRGVQQAAAHQLVKMRVVGTEVLDALHDPFARDVQAILVVDHVPPWNFGQGDQLVRPACDIGNLAGAKQTAPDEPSGAGVVIQVG